MRELSSRWTIFYKVVFPVFWIGVFATGTLAMFVFPDSIKEDPPDGEIHWVFLCVTLAGSAFIYGACIRLKRVSLADTTIVVSKLPGRDHDSTL